MSKPEILDALLLQLDHINANRLEDFQKIWKQLREVAPNATVVLESVLQEGPDLLDVLKLENILALHVPNDELESAFFLHLCKRLAELRKRIPHRNLVAHIQTLPEDSDFIPKTKPVA